MSPYRQTACCAPQVAGLTRAVGSGRTAPMHAWARAVRQPEQLATPDDAVRRGPFAHMLLSERLLGEGTLMAGGAARDRLGQAVSIVLSAVAVLLAALVVRRELLPSASRASVLGTRRAYAAEEARRVDSRRVRGPDGPLLVVFSDYECPYCRSLALVLDSLQRAGLRFRYAMRSYPAGASHPMAFRAAIATECAAAQGQ